METLAASSSSPSSSSTTPATTNAADPAISRPYDVFLNHRGPDVKNSLASFLYHWLEDKGLRVFLDKEEFQAGDRLHSTIEQAISSTSIHIAIFSEKYAESRWCLDELCLMLESGAKIIPVFCDVRPSDLRWIAEGKGVYADAFAIHEEKRRVSSQTIDRWKAALQEISYRHGLELQGSAFNGDMGKLSKSIVDDVVKAVVNKVPLEVAKYPVGLDEAVRHFQNFMQCEHQIRNEAVKTVGIVGFGGSGKTTLAKHFYNLHQSSFDRSSFLCDVRDASAKNTLQSLQSQLLKDLFDIDERNIANVSEGRAILRRALRSSASRVLIVLDDIDHENQVEDLLVEDVLRRGTLILITARDEGAITRHSGAASVYRIKPLDAKYARELFCWYAFQKPHPMIGFEDLVENFCEKCGRLPLFLKLMGAHLRVNGGCESDNWKEELEYMPDDITHIMKFSFDALSTEEKQIFLDVACFFVGENKNMAIRVWNASERRGSVRLKILENKCLVEVDDEDRLKMHDHLRDFGRDIANEDSPLRFWNSNQFISLREQPKGRKHVRGIMAATREDDNCLICNSSNGNPFEEINFSGLKLLVIKGNCFESRFGQLSTNLTWLRWYDCPHTNVPSWLFSIQNLTVLQLIGGRLKEWPGCDKQLRLKELKINKTQLSNISIPSNVCPQLEHLDLTDNECLIEVEHLPITLLVLNLKNCTRLERTSGIFYLNKLKMLDIHGCQNLRELPNLKHLRSLEQLKMRNCYNLQNVQGLEHLRMLRELNMGMCSQLRELPNLSDLSSLETLEAIGCNRLQNIQGLEHLAKLRYLNIGCCSELCELPNLSNLISLESLKVWDCIKLQNIQGLQHLQKLQRLDIDGCSGLRELPNLSNLSSLETFEALRCTELQNIQGLEQLQKLRELYIGGCSELSDLPNLSNLSFLETLLAWDCSKLQNMQGLEHLRKLRYLNIGGCSELRELPDLSNSSSLETLEAWDCIKLENIQGLLHLRKLRELNIVRCSELRKLPNLSDLSSLETLKTRDCIKLQNIQGLQHLQKLRELDIVGCSELCELPNLSDLGSLETLYARDCIKLQNIQGLQHLRKLRELHIGGCSELRELPNLSDLGSLETLYAWNCIKLQNIQGLQHLLKLRELHIGGCLELRELPNLSDLGSLETLYAWDCIKLQNIQGLQHLPKLRKLNVAGCLELRELPNLSDLGSLETLYARNCIKLQTIQGLQHVRNLKKLDLHGCSELRELPDLSDLSSLESLEA